jgi:hypothetical protein
VSESVCVRGVYSGGFHIPEAINLTGDSSLLYYSTALVIQTCIQTLC